MESELFKANLTKKESSGMLDLIRFSQETEKKE